MCYFLWSWVRGNASKGIWRGVDRGMGAFDNPGGRTVPAARVVGTIAGPVAAAKAGLGATSPDMGGPMAHGGQYHAVSFSYRNEMHGGRADQPRRRAGMAWGSRGRIQNH